MKRFFRVQKKQQLLTGNGDGEITRVYEPQNIKFLSLEIGGLGNWMVRNEGDWIERKHYGRG